MPANPGGDIGTAIVGYGYAGRVMHAQLIQAAPGLRLLAVSSRSPERRQQAVDDWGVRAYPDLDSLFGDRDVELVVIATPHDTHHDLAIRCLQAGRHVVTDKLMCLNAAEADAMIAAARRAQRMLSIFQNRRWDGDYLTLRKALDDGLLGTPLVVEAGVTTWRHPRADIWRSKRVHGGGSFRDWGAHLIDQALLLIDGPVEAVQCDMLYTEPAIDVETAARCTLRFGNGVLYTVETGYISPLPRPRWHLRGTRGAFRKCGLDPQENALRRGEVSANLPQPDAERAEVCREMAAGMCRERLPTLPGNWPAYFANVAEHLHGRAELAVKAEEVRRVMTVIDAAVASAATGDVVRGPF